MAITARHGIEMEEAIRLKPSPQLRKPSQQIHRKPHPPISQPQRNDELFFSPLSVQAPGTNDDGDESSVSYVKFENAVSNAPNGPQTHWSRYDPPRELLEFPGSTSADIQGLLSTSIERIRVRQTEEHPRLGSVATPETSSARPGKQNLESNLNVSIGEASNPSHPQKYLQIDSVPNRPDSSNGSTNGSVLTGTESSSSAPPARTKRRPIFGIFSTISKSKAEDNKTGRPSLKMPALSREAPAFESLTGECVSCLEDFATGKLIKLSCHSYCAICFQRLIEMALKAESNWPAKCCLNPIPSATIFPHIDSQTKRLYRQREIEWSVPVGDRIYCAQPACNAWIPPKNINEQRHSAKCPKCAGYSCTMCRGQYHNVNEECPSDSNLQATMKIAQSEGWKRCYSCHAMVEHNKGCRHMTCLCKAQFCYVCGLRWRTCACTDAQLLTIQQQAVTQRNEETARATRAAAEAEEERIVLQMVEDFEREEAERAARAAEAQRIIQEEERQRREAERLVALHIRFRRLTAELEELHGTQQAAMSSRQRCEGAMLKSRHMDVLNSLSERHTCEEQFAVLELEKRKSDFECRFKKEYQARLVEERRVEHEYLEQLREFWMGKEEAERRIQEARDELRRDLEEAYLVWAKYNRQRLSVAVEEENRRVEMVRVKQVAEVREENCRAAVELQEWRSRIWAHGNWMRAVMRERVVMLQLLEQEELVVDT